LSCKSDCIDNRPVPAWGYYCASPDSKYGQKWVQCQSDGGCPPPRADTNFRQTPDPEPWCVVGQTPYAN
jgi:hypothetical protein